MAAYERKAIEVCDPDVAARLVETGEYVLVNTYVQEQAYGEYGVGAVQRTPWCIVAKKSVIHQAVSCPKE